MGMEKESSKRSKVFFGILAILLFGMVDQPISAATSQDSMEAISEVDLTFFMTNPKLPWGTDPFRKNPGYMTMPKSDANAQFSLGGIIYSKNVPMAVINGKTVKEGDRVGDRVVSIIGDNFVILKKKDSELELTLPPLADEGVDSSEGGEE